MSIEQSSMSGGTRGRSFTGLFAPPKCAASGRVIQAGCQLWMIKIIGRLTRPCSGWPLPFTAHSPRGSAWCSTSRKAETMLGRSFSGKTARGPRRRGACGKGRRSTCPRFLACYSNTNKDCIERYERGEVKRRFSTQPRRVGTLRGDPRPAARCGERDFFRSNDDEYKQARLLSKSHHHYSPRAAKLNNARRAELPRGTASSAMARYTIHLRHPQGAISGCYSPNVIEQTAHCDHKPRAAWVYVRLLLHRRSAAGWAECMIYSALVSFF